MFQITCPKTSEMCSDFFKRGKMGKEEEGGRQRYTCRKCGFTTVGERKEKGTSFRGTKRQCCENPRIVANGTYKVVLKNGTIEVRQRYKCDCKKGFSQPLRYE